MNKISAHVDVFSLNIASGNSTPECIVSWSLTDNPDTRYTVQLSLESSTRTFDIPLTATEGEAQSQQVVKGFCGICRMRVTFRLFDSPIAPIYPKVNVVLPESGALDKVVERDAYAEAVITAKTRATALEGSIQTHVKHSFRSEDSGGSSPQFDIAVSGELMVQFQRNTSIPQYLIVGEERALTKKLNRSALDVGFARVTHR